MTSSASLHPEKNITLRVIWSDRVSSFAQEWAQRLATSMTGPDPDHWGSAASSVLGTLEQQAYIAEFIAVQYRVTGHLPIIGDQFQVGSLDLRVDGRVFERPRPVVGPEGLEDSVEVTYVLGVDQYRYLTLPTAAIA